MVYREPHLTELWHQMLDHLEVEHPRLIESMSQQELKKYLDDKSLEVVTMRHEMREAGNDAATADEVTGELAFPVGRDNDNPLTEAGRKKVQKLKEKYPEMYG